MSSIPDELPAGRGWFHDGHLYVRTTLDQDDPYGGVDIDGPWYAVIDGRWVLRAWTDIQPGVPAVDFTALAAQHQQVPDWAADMEAAPVGAMAVFADQRGLPLGFRRFRDGSWGLFGRSSADLIAVYGDPVALHYPQESS